MWPHSWLDRLCRGASRARPCRRRTTTPLLLEVLEDRTVPSFVAPIASYPTGSSPQAVLAADFTGDSLADLAVVNNGDNNVSVLKNLGGGSFDTALNSATGTGPRSLAVGDLNGDGKLDLVTNNGITVAVMLGNGDGTFGPPASLTLPGQFPPGYTGTTSLPQTPLSVAVGDLNGDGTMDLVVATNTSFSVLDGCGYYSCYYHTQNDGYVNVLLGNGGGTFASPTVTHLNSGNPLSIALGYVNTDSNLDVLTANEESGTVSVLLGNGNGTLQAPVDSSAGYYPLFLAVGDLNGDG
ncbi:MAG: VCBS repeat-containing protein, partial [Planctomycetes bacterium]|nr:VCBS repeat-containing protein [Planctomycetota bacterium]